jgi:hypothetical protein
VTLTPDELQRLAESSGFSAGSLEKVLRLLALLDAIRAHPFLEPRVALKGGTALNLFLLDVPRLSVDIDLNYVGAADRAGMLADRDPLEQALRAVCSRLDLTVRRVPAEHAGGKWRLTYRAADGGNGTIEVDMNFVLRTPLWPVAMRDARPLAPGAAVTRFAVLDAHELAAGKLAALIARGASRDLFDARELLRRGDLDPARLRFAFVVYGGLNRVDWRTVDASRVTTTATDVASQLVPMLRRDLAPARRDVDGWTDQLVRECQELLSAVLPLAPAELAFLERLNGTGEIVPELLTDDVRLQGVVRAHPGLLWKALNVRRRLAGDATPADEEPTA